MHKNNDALWATTNPFARNEGEKQAASGTGSFIQMKGGSAFFRCHFLLPSVFPTAAAAPKSLERQSARHFSNVKNMLNSFSLIVKWHGEKA